MYVENFDESVKLYSFISFVIAKFTHAKYTNGNNHSNINVVENVMFCYLSPKKKKERENCAPCKI